MYLRQFKFCPAESLSVYRAEYTARTEYYFDIVSNKIFSSFPPIFPHIFIRYYPRFNSVEWGYFFLFKLLFSLWIKPLVCLKLIYIYIYRQHFFVNANFIKNNRHLMSTYFLLDPFEFPYYFYRIRGGIDLCIVHTLYVSLVLSARLWAIIRGKSITKVM